MSSISPSQHLDHNYSLQTTSQAQLHPPASTAQIQVNMVAEDVFQMTFGTLEDLLPEEFSVICLSDQKDTRPAIITTGCATCIGIVGKSYSADDKLARVGLTHFYGLEDEFIDFLDELQRNHATSAKISKVVLAIFGSYGIVDYITMINEILDSYPEISLTAAVINPWGVTKDYHKYEKIIDSFGVLSLSVAVDRKGEIHVANAQGTPPKGITFKTLNGFVQFSHVLEVAKSTLGMVK